MNLRPRPVATIQDGYEVGIPLNCTSIYEERIDLIDDKRDLAIGDQPDY